MPEREFLSESESEYVGSSDGTATNTCITQARNCDECPHNPFRKGHFGSEPEVEYDEAESAQNTDKEIWRKIPDDYYSPSIYVTQSGQIGMNVGGHVIIASVEEWHKIYLEHLLKGDKK